MNIRITYTSNDIILGLKYAQRKKHIAYSCFVLFVLLYVLIAFICLRHDETYTILTLVLSTLLIATFVTYLVKRKQGYSLLKKRFEQSYGSTCEHEFSFEEKGLVDHNLQNNNTHTHPYTIFKKVVFDQTYIIMYTHLKQILFFPVNQLETTQIDGLYQVFIDKHTNVKKN